jgi:hypothetical protein
MQPLTENEIFNKPIHCRRVQEPVVREYIEKLIGWKRPAIQGLTLSWADPALSNSEKMQRFMMTMKHMERALEHAWRNVNMRYQIMINDTISVDDEDEEDPEELFYLRYALSDALADPWPLKCKRVMSLVRDYIGDLCAEVHGQHQGARSLVYRNF